MIYSGNLEVFELSSNTYPRLRRIPLREGTRGGVTFVIVCFDGLRYAQCAVLILSRPYRVTCGCFMCLVFFADGCFSMVTFFEVYYTCFVSFLLAYY